MDGSGSIWSLLIHMTIETTYLACKLPVSSNVSFSILRITAFAPFLRQFPDRILSASRTPFWTGNIQGSLSSLHN